MSGIIIGGLIAMAMWGAVPAIAAPAIEEIAPAEVRHMLEAPQVVIVDVRSAAEYEAGHVPGAINIPHTAIIEDTAVLNSHRDQQLIVYCRSGRRATIALDALQRAGYRNLGHMTGDMPGWEAAERSR